jgi:hypothetical protein
MSEVGDRNFAQIVPEPEVFQKPLQGSGEMVISSWQLIFKQSRVNNGAYHGDRLPAQNWHWPQGTWFQTRLRNLRSGNTNNKFTQ